jgi:hypothetical protein
LHETGPFAAGAAAVELESVPFFPDTELQCGPSALATVLGAAGVPAAPEALRDEVYTPGLGGSLQLELVAAARARGFVPYVAPPEPAAVLAELAAGRPVLVLQNLRLESWPAWHYAVLVGADPVAGTVVLRSGGERRLVLDWQRFVSTWRKGGGWSLALLPPGELPAMPDRQRYYDAVLGLEESGRYADAARAWQAAVERWPEDAVPAFGLAVARQLDGREAAAAAYRALLARHPEHAAALNNLADLAAGSGCPLSARRLAEMAVEHAASAAVAAAARDTLAGLPAADTEPDRCRDEFAIPE